MQSPVESASGLLVHVPGAPATPCSTTLGMTNYTGVMFKRLLSPPEQSRAAKTVEVYGWIIFFEGELLLLIPDFMAKLIHFGPMNPQASGFLRLIGMLVSGFGMLYVLS